jgi:hypothetical protein
MVIQIHYPQLNRPAEDNLRLQIKLILSQLSPVTPIDVFQLKILEKCQRINVN